MRISKSQNKRVAKITYNKVDSSETNSLLLKAKYNLVFAHPEAVLSCKKGIELFQSMPYQQYVQAVAVDEAHYILQW